MRFVAHSNRLVSCVTNVEDKQCLTPYAVDISDGRMAQMFFEAISDSEVSTNLGTLTTASAPSDVFPVDNQLLLFRTSQVIFSYTRPLDTVFARSPRSRRRQRRP